MKRKRIYLSPPHMSEQEKRYLIDAYDSNWVAPLGPHVDGFEKEMSEYLNVKNAAALNSGTSALHLALRILDIKAGDKVLRLATFMLVPMQYYTNKQNLFSLTQIQTTG